MNPTRERGDLDGGAGGANLAQILGVDCVVGGEVFVEIREEAGDIHDVFQAGSGGFEDDLEVVKDPVDFVGEACG